MLISHLGSHYWLTLCELTATRSAAHSKPPINKNNHDTIGESVVYQRTSFSSNLYAWTCDISIFIGMVVVTDEGKIACGTTTNGLTNKIAGLVVKVLMENSS